MKTRKLLFYLFITGVIAFVLQLFLHELGHVVFAIITGNKVEEFSIASSSYTGVNVSNLNSIPLISIGSFILPIAFCIAICFLKSNFLIFLNIYVGVITSIQLGINGISLLTVDNTSPYYNTYDLQMFVNSTNFNPIVVCVISLVIAMVLAFLVISKGLKTICKL